MTPTIPEQAEASILFSFAVYLSLPFFTVLWIGIVVMPIRNRLSILMPIQIRIRIGIGTMLIGMRILPEVLHMFESREIFFYLYSLQC